ncbi:MAG: S26 family signal peptidase [Mariniblastus sp.]|nr:S26 family signal peptidase [Mariniblastus sp.]
MAPSFLGRHYQMTCGDCRFVFACDGINIPADRQTVCPNCGYAANELQPAEYGPAERVSILKSDRPARWDVVAVKLHSGKEDSPRYAVKRVVAMPGEELRLLDGDVFIDGEIVAKPLDVQRRVRIPIFDSDYRSVSDPQLSRRLLQIPGSLDTLVQASGQESRSGVPTAGPGWEIVTGMRFQPVTAYRSKEAGEPIDRIKDFYAYNQNLSRKLNTTDQLYMQYDLLAEPDVRITFQVPGSHPIRISLDVETVDLEQVVGSEMIHQSFQMPRRTGIGLKVEISSFDQRLQLIVNGCELFDVEAFAFQAGLGQADMTPMAMVIGPGVCRLNRLQIWRDIHYFDDVENHFSGNSPKQTKDDEFFILGDNVPVSVDSRHWEVPAVTRSQIIGIVTGNSAETTQ